MTRTAARLRAAGAQVVEVTPPYQDRPAELEFPALLSEFNRTHPAEQTCFAGQELFEQALVAPSTTDPEYLSMRAELKNLSRRSIDETMAAHDLDAIPSPANPLHSGRGRRVSVPVRPRRVRGRTAGRTAPDGR